MSGRKDFEENFPIPSGVKWSEKQQDYTYECIQALQVTCSYSGRWQAWKAAKAKYKGVALTNRSHQLKTDPIVFGESISGRKHWEIRLNDRDFQIGDTVILNETRYSGHEMALGKPLEYTGRKHTGVIAFVLNGPLYGIADGWCVFSLNPVQPEPPQ